MPDETRSPLFSPDELADRRRKVELIDACASGESILVAGAGLSKRLGYPDWSELLDKLNELALSLETEDHQPFVKPPDWATTPLRYADCLRDHICRSTNGSARYYSFLQQTFGDRGHDALHRQLVEIPFRGFVTVNYDPSLDNALADKEPARAVDNHFVVDRDNPSYVREFLIGLRRKDSVRRIAHLHGRFSQPAGIVLTERDYQNHYESRFEPEHRQQLIELIEAQGPNAALEQVERNLPEWSLHRKFLWTLLSSRSVVFVGFSMEDPYFTQMLSTVVNDLWLWDQPSHFAVMALSPSDALARLKARRLHSDFGVAVVFYENRDGQNHGELEGFIQEICGACGGGRPQALDRATEELHPPVHEKRPVSEWMATVNERMRRRGNK